MFLWYFVLPMSMLLKFCVHLLLCLQALCTSVLYKSPTPLGAPLSVGEGLGVRLYHRERENQINTLVLKDINFTINIIELSYYRTIDTLNQSKNAPVARLCIKQCKKFFAKKIKIVREEFRISSRTIFLLF